MNFQFQKFKTELKNELKSELKSELTSEIIQQCKELFVTKTEFNEFRNEMYEFRNEMYEFRKEIQSFSKKLDRQLNQLNDYNKWNDKCHEYISTSALEHHLSKQFTSHKIIKPKNKNVPKNIFYIDPNHKRQTLTDFDGVLIGIPNGIASQYNQNTQNNGNFNYNYYQIHDGDYKLFILESKHKITLSIIKHKLLQILRFIKLLEKEEIEPMTNFMKKIKKEHIYLFFSAPFIEKSVMEFIQKQTFLHEDYWRSTNSKESLLKKHGFTTEDLTFFINRIGFVTDKGFNYTIE